ncbi:MAG: hypothetical protein CM1200mP30_34560 [Pseudomonadota bacterium]|nr:MAG: hypothetical protein CM1200mP30_34560 [Pseudomonadota bacterium]
MKDGPLIKGCQTGITVIACPISNEWKIAWPEGDVFRGDDGPLKMERGPCDNPLFSAFFDAVQQAGYPLTDDVNGYRQEGFASFDRNLYRGRRLSAARAYFLSGQKSNKFNCYF